MMQNIQWIRCLLRVSFDILEENVMDLLMEIERRRQEKALKDRQAMRGK